MSVTLEPMNAAAVEALAAYTAAQDRAVPATAPGALAAALTVHELQGIVSGLIQAREALRLAQRGLCVAAFEASPLLVEGASARLVQVLAELEASAAALHGGLDPRQPEYIALSKAYGLPQDVI